MEVTSIQVGDTWLIYGAEWRVVGPQHNGWWPMSGPGPCRGMDYMPTAYILHGSLVAREKAPVALGGSDD